MRYLLAIISAALLLSGCATNTGSYGNFTHNNPYAFEKGIAKDVVTKLDDIYPPGRTQFDIGQPADDTFGVELLSSLRNRGYAVMEYDSKHPNKHDQIMEKARARKVPKRMPNISLRYVLDRAGTLNLYRVTLVVGGYTLSRPYAIKDDSSALAIGFWARQE